MVFVMTLDPCELRFTQFERLTNYNQLKGLFPESCSFLERASEMFFQCFEQRHLVATNRSPPFGAPIIQDDSFPFPNADTSIKRRQGVCSSVESIQFHRSAFTTTRMFKTLAFLKVVPQLCCFQYCHERLNGCAMKIEQRDIYPLRTKPLDVSNE